MAKEDFRRGMLYGFASQGLNPEDVGELLLGIDKQAGILGSAADMTTAALVGVPAVAGVLSGAAAHQLFGPEYKANIDALRTQDIINEVRMLRRNQQRRVRQGSNNDTMGTTSAT